MKNELRNKYLLIRKNIKKKETKDQIIFNKVITNERVINSSLILIYISTPYEVDTINLINYFLKLGKRVAVPKVAGKILEFYQITSINECQKGTFNILEPTNLNNKITNFKDAISITPGVCFDKQNYRIGYGKGFYDRFYQTHNIYSIGLCYQECYLDKINHFPFDKKCNLVITD